MMGLPADRPPTEQEAPTKEANYTLANAITSSYTWIPVLSLIAFALAFAFCVNDRFLSWIQRNSFIVVLLTLIPLGVAIVSSSAGKAVGNTTPWEPSKVPFLLGFAAYTFILLIRTILFLADFAVRRSAPFAEVARLDQQEQSIKAETDSLRQQERDLLKRIVAIEAIFAEQRKTHQLAVSQAKLQDEKEQRLRQELDAMSRAEQQTLARIEEIKERIPQLEEARRRVEVEAQERAEQEQQLKLTISVLHEQEEEQIKRTIDVLLEGAYLQLVEKPFRGNDTNGKTYKAPVSVRALGIGSMAQRTAAPALTAGRPHRAGKE